MPFLTQDQWVTTHKTLTFEALPAPLQGLKVVHISDLHFYEKTDRGYWKSIIDAIQSLEPDVLVCTGDIIHYGHKFLGLGGEIMSQLRGRLGQWGVLGNHDYHDGQRGDAVSQMMEDSGWSMLRNTQSIIEIDGASLRLAGVDDMLAGRPNLEAALSGDSSPSLTLLLAHNPVLFDVVTTHYSEHVDLVLSGHTHASHVYLPGLRWAYDEMFKIPYRYGLYQRKDCQLYVTSGVESTAFYLFKKSLQIALPRYRVNCFPEIACLELQST